ALVPCTGRAHGPSPTRGSADHGASQRARPKLRPYRYRQDRIRRPDLTLRWPGVAGWLCDGQQVRLERGGTKAAISKVMPMLTGEPGTVRRRRPGRLAPAR